MPDIGKLVKEAARAQQKMAQIQAQLATRTVEGSSGGGAVKVVAKCDGSVTSIKIDPQAVNPAEVSLLEDMVLAAVNAALRQGQEISANELGKVTRGLNLPGLM